MSTIERKITLIGAGSTIFARRIVSDILSLPELKDTTKISLMDINRERLGDTEKVIRTMIDRSNSKSILESTLDRREAINGADYVITMIQVGGADAFKYDIEIPKKYGVEQAVGDTLGPGGIMKGARVVPQLLKVTNDMDDLCPNALLIQYCNPLAIVTWALNKSSKIETVGLCHGVEANRRLLADYISKPYEEIAFKAAGINHNAWFIEFKWKGEDAYPLLRGAIKNPEVYNMDPIRFEAVRYFGYFPTETSAHFSEYVPYFRKNMDMINEMAEKANKAGTCKEFIKAIESTTPEFLRWTPKNPGVWLPTGSFLENYIKRQETRKGKIERLLKGEGIDIARTAEYAVRIIHAKETGEVYRANLNVQNEGLIDNLPQGACVEVPTLLDETGINPCRVGKLPTQVAAIIRTNISVQELAIEAILNRDRDTLSQAMALDPLTSSVLSLPEIRDMTDELLEKEKRWLPQFE